MSESKWAQGASFKWLERISILLVLLLWTSICMKPIQTQGTSPDSNSSTPAVNSSSVARRQNLQLISNWLELIAANRQNDSRQSFATGVALEVSPPPANSLFQYQPAGSSSRRAQSQQPPNSRQILVATASRNARTTSADRPEQPVDLFVSNVCERDFMLIKVRTSQPFYGVIHTLNYRRKPHCAIEGDGGNEFQLNISHVLDSRDSQHCGVIKLTRGSSRRQSPNEQDDGELLSVVLAIRTSRSVELPDDKFLVLNCTNRCRQLDCSSGNSSRLASISQQQRPFEDSLVRQRQLERESEAEIRPVNSQDQRSWWSRAAAKRPGGSQQQLIENKPVETCSIWRFPWLLALILCLAILLAGCAVSNCIICRLRLAPSRVSIESHSDLDLTRPKHEVKQHTIYYDNERRGSQRQTPADASPGRSRRSRSRPLHERPPDRRSR